MPSGSGRVPYYEEVLSTEDFSSFSVDSRPKNVGFTIPRRLDTPVSRSQNGLTSATEGWPAVPQGGEYDVFLSYARADSEQARPLRDALRAQGLEVFFDDREIEAF
jgi:hypothetical protein